MQLLEAKLFKNIFYANQINRLPFENNCMMLPDLCFSKTHVWTSRSSPGPLLSKLSHH